MGVPNPITFTPFDILPASSLNDMRENEDALADGSAIDELDWSVTDLTNPYKFFAYLQGTQTLASGAVTVVELDAELFDTNSNFNPATHRWTAPITGFYQINASITATLGTNATIIGYIYKNGTTPILGGQNSNSTAGVRNTTATSNHLIPLTAGDTLELRVGASSGSGTTLPNDTYGVGELYNVLSGYLVSKA